MEGDGWGSRTQQPSVPMKYQHAYVSIMRHDLHAHDQTEQTDSQVNLLSYGETGLYTPNLIQILMVAHIGLQIYNYLYMLYIYIYMYICSFNTCICLSITNNTIITML
jgi:hypothetical protein